MNKKIKGLDYNNLLFFDIETVRGEEVFDENHPFYDVWAWKQRDKETNEISESKEVIESYYNKAALFAEWGKIVCISVGYINNEELYVKSFVGEEKDILTNFIDLVKKTGRMLSGFNLINFDVPYLRKRFFINGLEEYLTDKQGNDCYMKPWLLDDAIFDLMVAWKGSGFVNTSMDELAMSFGIPSSKDDMHGNEVSKYFYEGKIDKIAEYCEKDVAVTANILRRWKGDSILEPKIKKEVKDQRTVLQKLYDTEELTDTIKKELEETLSKKRITKKDKENLFKILRGVWIQTDFVNMNQDGKSVIADKEAELKQFLDEL